MPINPKIHLVVLFITLYCRACLLLFLLSAGGLHYPAISIFGFYLLVILILGHLLKAESSTLVVYGMAIEVKLVQL